MNRDGGKDRHCETVGCRNQKTPDKTVSGMDDGSHTGPTLLPQDLGFQIHRKQDRGHYRSGLTPFRLS